MESMRVARNNRRNDAQAARWVVRLEAGSLSASEQAELDAWLESDPRNRGALIRAQAVWLDLDRVAALAQPSGRRSSSSDGLVEPPVFPRRWVLAAGLGSIAVGGVGGWWSWRARGDSYVSGEGEIRRVTLADGSVMTLNSSSRARVDYTPAQRSISLERGEALFEVTKDRARPFVVSAGNLSVRAVGTAFAVWRRDSRTYVTVAEGVVEVSDPHGPSRESGTQLTANELGVATHTGLRIQRLTPQDLDRRLAWREGMLIFDGQTLSEAVREINRYGRKPIRIDDPQLAARPVVGLFRAGDSEGFAKTVAAALGAKSVVGNTAIHLSVRQAP